MISTRWLRYDWIKKKARVDHQSKLLHVRILKEKRTLMRRKRVRGSFTMTELANILDYGSGAEFFLLTSLTFYCTPSKRTDNPTPEATDLLTRFSCIDYAATHDKKNPTLQCVFVLQWFYRTYLPPPLPFPWHGGPIFCKPVKRLPPTASTAHIQFFKCKPFLISPFFMISLSRVGRRVAGCRASVCFV